MRSSNKQARRTAFEGEKGSTQACLCRGTKSIRVNGLQLPIPFVIFILVRVLFAVLASFSLQLSRLVLQLPGSLQIIQRVN